MAALGAAAVIAGFAMYIAYADVVSRTVERVQLPGFSVELPAGEVTETSKSPSMGSHKVEIASSLVGELFRGENATPTVSVNWMSRFVTHEEWRDVHLPKFIRSLGDAYANSRVLKEEDIDGQRWLYIVGPGDVSVGFGSVSCAEDFQVVVVLGRYRETDRQAGELGKILRSVKCSIIATDRIRPTAAARPSGRPGLD
jgi:hypothetical protein